MSCVCLAFLLTSWAAESAAVPAATILALNLISLLSGGWFGAVDAVSALRQRRLDINVLMIVAAIGAASVDQWHEGAALLFLFSLSNVLQGYAMDRAQRAIGALATLRPSEANVLRDGVEVRVALADIRPGDRLRVRPGEMVAADGVVCAGRSNVNQSSITGESLPVEKGPGDVVYSGTLVSEGALEVEVTRPASESTLERIIRLVETAKTQKAALQTTVDRYEGVYAALVIGAALSYVAVSWLLLHRTFDLSFYRAMVLLVVASPCALVISTPASTLSAMANAARRGILFKGGAQLEQMAAVRVVAFDKTGTLTSGRLRVTDVTPARQAPPGLTSDRVLATAAGLESHSEHPIARTVMAAAAERGLSIPAASEFRSTTGRGLSARVDGYLTWVGGHRLFEQHGESVPSDVEAEKARLERQGKTALVVHRELERNGSVGTHESWGGWLGVIGVADSLRPEASRAVERLRPLGVVRTVMLTGDNPLAAAEMARSAGVDEFAANLLPEDKVATIARLSARYGPVLMVGDGVNDAPALAAAAVGMAMGAAGSDVALETADVVLMNEDLRNVPYALGLSRRTRRIIRQNLLFSLGVIGLLVAAAVGYSLPLTLGVVGHEGSTLIVVLNSLRLLAYDDPVLA